MSTSFLTVHVGVKRSTFGEKWREEKKKRKMLFHYFSTYLTPKPFANTQRHSDSPINESSTTQSYLLLWGRVGRYDSYFLECAL